MQKGIGIAGIAGRMGRLLAEEVLAAGVKLTGGIDRDASAACGTLFDGIDALAAASDVVVDFTHASAVAGHAEAIGRTNSAWVLGTTGLSVADEAKVADAARHVSVVYAANYSPGVNLVLALAEQMARALPAAEYDAEIVEMHHRQKVDAPSGTAVAMGRAVAAGRGVDFDAVKESGRDGHTGARKDGAIGFAALRGGQIVGEHTLLFAAAHEQIALTHRAFDRRAFATGAIRAAVWVVGKPPGLYSMRHVLGMETVAPG